MSDRDTLLALAERCEAATGPDRELDADIAVCALGYERDATDFYLAGDRRSIREPDYYDLEGQSCELSHLTTSIDAALTLKPNGLGLWLTWSSFNRERPIAEVVLTRTATTILNDSGYAYHCAETELVRAKAATPALALCAASLRARAAQ